MIQKCDDCYEVVQLGTIQGNFPNIHFFLLTHCNKTIIKGYIVLLTIHFITLPIRLLHVKYGREVAVGYKNYHW